MALSVAPAEFFYSIRPMTSRLIEIEYAGYMPEDDAHVRLTEQIVLASAEPVGLYYFVADFTGYHRIQVARHGELFKRLGSKVRGIAVVGARPIVRFGAITVSLISNTPLKTFDQREHALAWLEAL